MDRTVYEQYRASGYAHEFALRKADTPPPVPRQPLVTDWTAEETETALSMWEAGKSATQIGRVLGRSRGAICGKMDRLRREGEKRAVARGRGASTGEMRERVNKRAYRKPRYTPPVTQRPKPRVVPSIMDAQAYDAASHHLDIMQLTTNDCRFIVAGEGADAEYCGHHAEKTYCAHHQARCFYTPKEGVTDYLARIAGGHSGKTGAFR